MQLATRLQRLGPEDSQFIYDAACDHCMEVATHRHGCCVLQRCIDFANGQQRRRLVNEISSNALVLSQVCMIVEGSTYHLCMVLICQYHAA